MNEKKRIRLRRLGVKVMLAILLFTNNAEFAFAQGGPGDPVDENPDNGVPFDGGVALLLVMAGLFVIFKICQLKWKHKLARQPGV